jgi:3-dehydroquinate synthetase
MRRSNDWHGELHRTADLLFPSQEIRDQILKAMKAQGQRVLTLFPGKDFGHEIEIPAATAAFHGDAVLAGMLLQ